MIQADKLSMYYGAIQALDSVDFKVEKGEIIGLLGPNGAGKSTTLKIITTYIYPSSGTTIVDGKDVRQDPLPIRKMIGYLPEQLPLYMDMEVQEYLKFVANARGLHGQELKTRINWVVEKCGLKAMYHKMLRQLSKGYRQRTALAQALIHDPQIVILDEPTSGLDPHQILEIRELVRELADSGKTIVFSTHILPEVQAITNRIIIINRGKIVADGTVEDLEAKTSDYMRCELILPADIAAQEVQDGIGKLEEVAKVVIGKQNGEVSYLIEGKRGKDLRQPLSQFVQQQNWKFLELKKKPWSLEEIFLTLTEPEKKGE